MMCVKQEIFKEEQLHLKDIRKKIGIELEKEQKLLDNQREELLKERKKMWEECAPVVRDFDDIIDLAFYDEQVRNEHGHYIRRDDGVRQLKYLDKTPYFGRIDFREDGEATEDIIYIGRYGFCNKQTYEYDIYDWRTPIASMFYDATQGRVSYQCPAGEIEGELVGKRQYRIVDGELKYCYDTDAAVQDEVLGEVLSENTDKVLRVIIDTITRDQNRAIRRSGGEDILVMGPAGSGKTSVGMHRLAYLLYHNREHLNWEKIVVMSRNEIFSSYVSGILPELGEENVREELFDRLINHGLPKELKKKWYYEQVEYLLEHPKASVRKKGIALKYSKAFLDYVRGEVKTVRRPDAVAAIELYMKLLKSFTMEKHREIYEYTKLCFERHKLCYEDALVVGYIRVLTGGIRPQDYISQVVIDEAQDYCPLQLRIMKLMYPKSRFTILADPNQAVYPEISTTTVAEFEEIFGNGLQVMELKKSYRSTAPINRYALGLIGADDPERYIDRAGKEPEVVDGSEQGIRLQELLAQCPENMSVGIMTCNTESARTARRVLERLSLENRPIQYIFRPDATLEEKTVVMPVMLAKGLEFDVVIIWDDKETEFWEKNKNLKYLMCTRALHELYILKMDPSVGV